jgi:hypothetical protein
VSALSLVLFVWPYSANQFPSRLRISQLSSMVNKATSYPVTIQGSSILIFRRHRLHFWNHFLGQRGISARLWSRKRRPWLDALWNHQSHLWGLCHRLHHVGHPLFFFLFFPITDADNIFSGFALQPFQEQFYQRRTALAGKSDPEARWGSSLYGIFLLPIGLFIAAWTSYPHISFIVPIIGFTLFGVGFCEVCVR